jgi:Zn-dependent protease with chaperone function
VTSQVKTILLLGVLSAALVAFGGMLGPGYPYFFTALAVLMNLGAYFFSDRIVLAMHEAREAAPRLHAVVEELAVRAEIPTPRVFVIEDARERLRDGAESEQRRRGGDDRFPRPPEPARAAGRAGARARPHQEPRHPGLERRAGC